MDPDALIPDAGPMDGAPIDGAAGDVASEPGIEWVEVAEVAVDPSGLSEAVEVRFPASRRYVALRAGPLHAPAAPGSACYRFEPIVLVSGRELVGPPETQARAAVCSACSQPVSSGTGAALAVLPSAADALAGPDTLRFRVALRDCELGIRISRDSVPDGPERLRVERAWAPSVPAGTRGRLRVRVGVGPGAAFSGRDLQTDPTFTEVWAFAAERFDAVGVDLILDRAAPIPGVGGAVRFSARHPEALIEVDEQVSEAHASTGEASFVPVALVGCLIREPPEAVRRFPKGFTPRIPGAPGQDTAPSLVTLATGDCGAPETPPSEASLEPSRLGAVLAHELGHYLGLYHADTSAGAHLAGPSERSLMHSRILDLALEDAWLSAAQGAVLRRHPLITFGDQLGPGSE